MERQQAKGTASSHQTRALSYEEGPTRRECDFQHTEKNAEYWQMMQARLNARANEPKAVPCRSFAECEKWNSAHCNDHFAYLDGTNLVRVLVVMGNNFTYSRVDRAPAPLRISL